MNRIKKIFGGINLTWKRLLLLSIIAGVYTALMALLPVTKNTSFRDITISFEVWILFGIFIIMNSRSAKDSALKCFVFFLISQPLVYLIQVPFSDMGWQLFTYYGYWFKWTLFTIPMGFIGYFMKKNKWWGILILIPILIFLGDHYCNFLKETIYHFPYHLLSAVFCLVTLLLYSVCVFEDKKIRNISLVISVVIIVVASAWAFTHKEVYETWVMSSGGDCGVIFDDSCSVRLKDDRLGTVSIEYLEDADEYVVSGKFTKAGETELVLTDKDGNEKTFHLNVGYATYDVEAE